MSWQPKDLWNSSTIRSTGRSKLVRLTHKGDARYRELHAQLISIASTMGVTLDKADIRKTIEIVRRLSDDVKARSERPS